MGEPGVARGLWGGSADPHGVGDVDRVPVPLRSPSLSMLTHIAASQEELARRPYAAANVPPVTPPRPPPSSPPSPAPLVTAVEQVVPAPQLRLVRGWMRSLRRCLRAASRGDLSAARRFRPDDMWIEHVACEGMGGWDWDLRPLERGEPAVPHPVSGVDGLLPSTSLMLEEVRAAAVGFDDQAIVSEMLHGVEDDCRSRRGTLLCAPHVGALRNFAVAAAKTRANIDEGWATGDMHCRAGPSAPALSQSLTRACVLASPSSVSRRT